MPASDREALERSADVEERARLKREAEALRERATAERAAGNDSAAARLLDRALAIYRDIGDLRGVTQVMGELAPVGGVKGISWPVAVGFLLIVLAVAGVLVFLGVRLVGDLLERGRRAAPPDAEPVPATVEPSPAITRPPGDGEPLRATPTRCDVSSSEISTEVSIDVRLAASERFEIVVLRGTLTARGGKVLGEGVRPVTPVRPGAHLVRIDFAVVEELPRGRLTCGVEIQTAVPAF